MGDERQSSVQSSPDPGRNNNVGGWKAITYILGNESFEKLASMSLIANMTAYLQKKYHMGGVANVNVTTIWSGSSNITSLLGALLADTYLGKFRTLLFGSLFSLLVDSSSVNPTPLQLLYKRFQESYIWFVALCLQGMGAMTLAAGLPQLTPPECESDSHCPQPEKWQLAFLFASLGFLSIGAGGIRPCNIAFGADQFDTTTTKGKAQLESFFNWWYFLFTIALLIALTVVVYIQTNVSWVIGFAIPTACLFLSISLFLLGRHTYIYKKPQGSIFADMIKVITAACRKRRITIVNDSQLSFYDPPMNESELHLKITHTDRFKFLDKAAMVIDQNELDEQGKPKNTWRLCSLQQVEQLKCLVAIVPVWISGIACLIAMDQQNAFGILQAIQMNNSVGSHFKIPQGWMGLTSMIALSIWISTYEFTAIRLAKRFTGKEKRLTIAQRINIGIIMSILCMVAAAICEKKRRKSALEHNSFASPITMAMLLPQFILSGLIEAFAAVAIMEFYTTRMPESMRTVAGAVFFLSLSIASYTGSLLINIIRHATKRNGKTPWLGGHDLNRNRLDYYYYIVAGIEAINLIYFNFFASRYAANMDPDSRVIEVELDNSSGCHSRNLQNDEKGDEEKELAD